MKPKLFQRPTYFHALIALLLFGAGTAILATTNTALRSLVTTAELDAANIKLYSEMSRLADEGNSSAQSARAEWAASQLRIREASNHVNVHKRIMYTGFGALGLTLLATLLTLTPLRGREKNEPEIQRA